MLLNRQFCDHIRTRRFCSTRRHERGHLKRAHEARDVSYCAHEAHCARRKKWYSEAAKPLKRCYLPSTPALDLATPALYARRTGTQRTSVDRKITNHCVLRNGLVV